MGKVTQYRVETENKYIDEVLKVLKQLKIQVLFTEDILKGKPLDVYINQSDLSIFSEDTQKAFKFNIENQYDDILGLNRRVRLDDLENLGKDFNEYEINEIIKELKSKSNEEHIFTDIDYVSHKLNKGSKEYLNYIKDTYSVVNKILDLREYNLKTIDRNNFSNISNYLRNKGYTIKQTKDEIDVNNQFIIKLTRPFKFKFNIGKNRSVNSSHVKMEYKIKYKDVSVLDGLDYTVQLDNDFNKLEEHLRKY